MLNQALISFLVPTCSALPCSENQDNNLILFIVSLHYSSKKHPLYSNAMFPVSIKI